MRDSRVGGIALIASPLASLVMMALHPTGPALRDDLATVMPINAAVHTLAIIVTITTFFGTLALWRALESREALATAALTAFAFGSVAIMFAAIANGFVAPELLRRDLDGGPAATNTYASVLTFTYLFNQICTKVYTVTASAAIILWSAAMLKSATFSRGLAAYGMVIGLTAALATLAGALRMDIHGFGAVLITQTIWFVMGGIGLVRVQRA